MYLVFSADVVDKPIGTAAAQQMRKSNTSMRVSMAILPANLSAFGKKISSQNDEDGIIEAIFRAIEPRSRYFVEFGIGPNWQDPHYTKGVEGNCTYLATTGWEGLFMDGGDHPEIFNIKKEFITPLNINHLLKKYSVPENFDIISIDIDGQDFYVWLALEYRPTLVITEYNANFGKDESVVMPYDADYRWDSTKYYGASLAAMQKLGDSKGYTLVYSNGVNAFFVLNSLLDNSNDFDRSDVYVQREIHSADPNGRPFFKV